MQHMTRAEFARHMKVNRSTVTRWIERGRIQINDRGLIDVSAAKRALPATESPEPHHQARSAQIAEQKAQQAAPPSSDAVDIALRLKRAMTKEKEAKAELAAMERDKIAGLLVDRGEVDYLIRDVGEVIRAHLEGLPDRVAPTLAAHNGDVAAIRSSLEGAIRDVLTEFAHHMGRKAEEVLE